MTASMSIGSGDGLRGDFRYLAAVCRFAVLRVVIRGRLPSCGNSRARLAGRRRSNLSGLVGIVLVLVGSGLRLAAVGPGRRHRTALQWLDAVVVIVVTKVALLIWRRLAWLRLAVHRYAWPIRLGQDVMRSALRCRVHHPEDQPHYTLGNACDLRRVQRLRVHRCRNCCGG